MIVTITQCPKPHCHAFSYALELWSRSTSNSTQLLVMEHLSGRGENDTVRIRVSSLQTEAGNAVHCGASVSRLYGALVLHVTLSHKHLSNVCRWHNSYTPRKWWTPNGCHWFTEKMTISAVTTNLETCGSSKHQAVVTVTTLYPKPNSHWPSVYLRC